MVTNIGGVVCGVTIGKVSISLVLPVLRVSKRGVGIMVDTVFEVSSLLGGQLKVIDIMLFGFGFCVEVNEGNK